MIESGWIFPDGSEYVCGGDNLIIHDRAVQWFVQGLQFQDSIAQKMISKEIEDFYWEHGVRSLYADYAIRRLGWIKVGTSLWRGITYAGFDWQANLIRPYEEDGYHIKNMYLSSSCFLQLKCNILLAIRNGRNR